MKRTSTLPGTRRRHFRRAVREDLMKRKKLGAQPGTSLRFREAALVAAAAGAVAVGAFAIGALAIGRLAIRRIVAGKVEFKSVKIRDLAVSRLRAGEVTVSGSLKLPATRFESKTS
jgi:hypothetical protein